MVQPAPEIEQSDEEDKWPSLKQIYQWPTSECPSNQQPCDCLRLARLLQSYLETGVSGSTAHANIGQVRTLNTGLCERSRAPYSASTSRRIQTEQTGL